MRAEDTGRPGNGILLCTEQTLTGHTILRPHDNLDPTAGWHIVHLGSHDTDSLPTIPKSHITFSTQSYTLPQGDTVFEMTLAQWTLLSNALRGPYHTS